MKAAGIVAVVVLVGAGAAAFALRGMAPSPESLAANKAFNEANETMMAGMMGNSVVYTGDPDLDFVTLMIPHHQGAIEMAEIAIKYGKDPAVGKLAEEIAEAQKAEIDLMQTWRRSRTAAPAIDVAAIKAAYVAIGNRMMDAMGAHSGDGHHHDTVLTGNTDRDFVTMMIPHHESAIEMAELQLKNGKDPDIRALSERIIAAQRQEIADMNAWLNAAR